MTSPTALEVRQILAQMVSGQDISVVHVWRLLEKGTVRNLRFFLNTLGGINRLCIVPWPHTPATAFALKLSLAGQVVYLPFSWPSPLPPSVHAGIVARRGNVELRAPDKETLRAALADVR